MRTTGGPRRMPAGTEGHEFAEPSRGVTAETSCESPPPPPATDCLQAWAVWAFLLKNNNIISKMVAMQTKKNYWILIWF